ncbi:bacterial transferase hexapeptide repeat protein [Acetobacteraceae bacterium AT-5844]|nr:bacterial transferase hexapeptide repeat protein [Acetobacteraceae bacterium AT-5844]
MIGDHVWIGDDALVLKGVTIGQASIIGARSVVTKDVPPNSVAVGTPARIIRRNVTWEHNIGTVTEEFYLPLEVVE